MNAHINPFKTHVDYILERQGGFFTFEDIVDYVRSGKMQSHTFGDSWGVTEIIDTPRKRVVKIVLVVGRLSEIPTLDHQVTTWAKGIGAHMIMGDGRTGWRDFGKERGWRSVSSVYMKDLC